MLFLISITNLNTRVFMQEITIFKGDYPNLKVILSVIRQKGESQNGCFNKAKHAKISEKQTFLTPCASGGKKCLFFGNFGVLCSLEISVLRFALLPYYRRFR